MAACRLSGISFGRRLNMCRLDFSKIERVLAAEGPTSTITATEKPVWSVMFLALLSADPSADEIVRFEAFLKHGDSRAADLESFLGKLPHQQAQPVVGEGGETHCPSDCT